MEAVVSTDRWPSDYFAGCTNWVADHNLRIVGPDISTGCCYFQMNSVEDMKTSQSN